MTGSDALRAYADLVEVRRKAARRNGAFVGFGYLVIIVIAAYLLRVEYSVDWDIIMYAFLALNCVLLASQQVSSEIANKSILDLIAVLQRARADAT